MDVVKPLSYNIFLPHREDGARARDELLWSRVVASNTRGILELSRSPPERHSCRRSAAGARCRERAAFKAYEDLGIRANVSGHIINKPFTDTIPYANEMLPKELLQQVNSISPPSTKDYIDFAKEALARFQDVQGRLRYVIAPSGPQRCTDDLLVAAHELAHRHGTPYHIHILETKTQAVTGREFYGKTLIRHMHDLGALGHVIYPCSWADGPFVPPARDGHREVQRSGQTPEPPRAAEPDASLIARPLGAEASISWTLVL